MVLHMDEFVDEFPIEKNKPKPPHGNTKTGLPFYRLKIGESFVVPPEDYTRASSARAHFQKKQAKAGNPVVVSSRQVKNDNGELIGYRFLREK